MFASIVKVYVVILHLTVVFILLDYHHVIYPIDIELTKVGRLFDYAFIRQISMKTDLPKSDSNWPLLIHSTKPLFSPIENVIVHSDHDSFVHNNFPYLMHLYTKGPLKDDLVRILYTMHFGGYYYINLSNIKYHPKVSRIKTMDLSGPLIVYTVNKDVVALLSMPGAVFWKYAIQLINMRMPIWKIHPSSDFVVGSTMIADALKLYEENDGQVEWVHM
eukprot:NODE_116_length_19003_cov_0.233707.p9 type:complete len:218 gc:universal NODE_116_length_19003_cov_0.233707:3507-4160(+)